MPTNFEILMDELKRDEGFRAKPYRCTAGKLTIGYGRNLDDVGISEKEGEVLLVNSMARAKTDLDENIPWWTNITSWKRRRVLWNMCFNLGIHGLLKFKKMLAACQSGDYETAAAEMESSAWASQVGERATRLIKLMKEG